MQTFLPYPRFSDSLRCLDDKRLGKQRVETYQILRILSGKATKSNKRAGWVSHPAVKMWYGSESALVYYGVWACTIWKFRGFNDTTLDKILDMYPKLDYLADLTNVRIQAKIEDSRIDIRSGISLRSIKLPWFVGDTAFHESHQSNLLRKDPEFYGQYGWDVEPGLPYVWPENRICR